MIRPMLASTPPFPLSDPRLEKGWWFEPKYDGIRCIATPDGLFSRGGQDITARFPEIVLPSITLDGELVIWDGGRMDFAATSRRTANNARSQPRATLMVFDLPEVAEAQRTRRDRLERWYERQVFFWSWTLVPYYWSGEAAWAAAMRMGAEGVIAKRLDGLYWPKRSSSWLKFKKSLRVSCFVGGWERGSGFREATFGALLLYVLNPNPDHGESRYVEVGKVGSGFTDADLEMVRRRIDTGEPFVVDVDCMEVTPDGKLRFPVYAGVRDDITAGDCLIDQLKETT